MWLMNGEKILVQNKMDDCHPFLVNNIIIFYRTKKPFLDVSIYLYFTYLHESNQIFIAKASN
jgi:hypothetical protein